MYEKIIDTCRKYGIHPAQELLPRPLSRKAWLLRDDSGSQWVVKTRPREEATSQVLASFPFLHPGFRYPESVTRPEDPFLLYPRIDGALLAEGPFEEPALIARIMEIIGRMQALMQSLALVPFFKETLNLRDLETDPLQQLRNRAGRERLRSSDSRRQEDRQREIADSYRWTQARVAEYCEKIRASGWWPEAPLDEYGEQLGKSLSLHVPVTGTNLAHTALHPEHLLLCPGDEVGILGWNVQSRPRFYMKYTYLAWCFFHSPWDDPTEVYAQILDRNSRKAFFKEHHQVFALCLMERLVRRGEDPAAEPASTSDNCPPPPARIHQAGELFTRCVHRLRAENEKAFPVFPGAGLAGTPTSR